MEEVKSLSKWWNNEMMVPSLSTSLCMVSGPGAVPLLRNLTNLISVWVSTSSKSRAYCPRQTCSDLGLQEDKNTHDYPQWICWLHWSDSNQYVRYLCRSAFRQTRFGKELCFVSVCLGDFVVVAQCWIIALTPWLEEVLDFAPRLAWIRL